ncbi:zinc finger protein CONSTANS-LIKE 5-like [Sesamum indicum]|uniref:Zinc finger protein CONSTANS-LIKE 5-like n=1 Tax=Sesamum indicum TaxID=4182 RepID=A0A6I9T5V4_SESIN|nr:zinc finger protein CONSTANS-LIKE 5-like [Sesamum indicum]
MGISHDGAGVARPPKSFTPGWNVAAKPCDYCSSAAALLFCHAHSAFMCMACDSKVHASDDKHERVWMCEVCEHAPAAVTCKADAAALCVSCDRDIHSANPLARRHERVAVVPFYETAESMLMTSSGAANLSVPVSGSASDMFAAPPSDGDSWASTNPIFATKLPADTPVDVKSLEFFFSDSDQFLDFDNYQISSQTYGGDSVVPVQTTIKPSVPVQSTHQFSPENRFEIDFTRSRIASYNSNYTTPSLSHSVSSSSMDVGIVPEGSSMSEISSRTMSTSSFDLSANPAPQPAGLDREARVLRYKEKRKNRKFDKTIRYASRKAYAETRPRIKGRFAKRTDSESDIDGIFSSGGGSFFGDARYGVVPSF